MSSSNAGVDDFFTFYAQLQQSCQFYSNLSLRQMLVGYQTPVSSYQVPKSENCSVSNDAQPPPPPPQLSTYTPAKAAPVMVVVSGCDSDTEIVPGSARTRKVNFATPLSTIKIKSPTPMHSMEELYRSSGDSSRTGFTSDSDAEGSDTDILANYFNNHLQVPTEASYQPGKKKKKRRKKKNKSIQYHDEYADESFQDNFDNVFDEDNVNTFEEVLPNEEDYEFVSDIRLCRSPSQAKPDAAKAQKNVEMTQLYGENGSGRILKMEENVELMFQQALKKVGVRK